MEGKHFKKTREVKNIRDFVSDPEIDPSVADSTLHRALMSSILMYEKSFYNNLSFGQGWPRGRWKGA